MNLSEPDIVKLQDFINRVAQQSFAYKDIVGQDRWETTWTPAPTSLTVVGTPTYKGRFKVVGKMCFFQVQFSSDTSVAATGGTTYWDMPIAAKGLSGFGSMQNATTALAAGNCYIDVTNSRIFIPTIVASGNTFLLSGGYEI